MPPTDAEWVAGRICVYLMAFLRVEIARLEQSGAEFGRLFVCGPRVLDVEVEMDLLRSRPFGRNVIRRKPHTDRPVSRSGNDAVKIVVAKHGPISAASNTIT